jgi:dienelactone hydrolase
MSRAALLVGLLLALAGGGYALVVPTERPLPPDGKSELVVRGHPEDVYFFPAKEHAATATKVLFMPGDGGLRGLAVEIAEQMAEEGYDVYALDTKSYLESFTTDTSTLTTDDVRSDLATVADWMRTRWRERILLVGWSEGAALVAEAATAPGERYLGVVAFGLPPVAELGWRTADDVTYVTGGTPDEPTFETRETVERLGGTPLFVIHASGDECIPEADERALFDLAPGPKRYLVVEADDHAFGGNVEGLYATLSEALEWTSHSPTS